MATEQTDMSKAQIAKILTVFVYVIWNYLLHLSYWYFEDSWLHYYVEHGNYFRLYGIHVLHVFTVLLYLCAAFYSPGSVVGIKRTSNVINAPKYCSICKIIRPRRSKHCYQCGQCIIKYDHHCIFTANCVGADNHRLFVFYLFIQIVFLSWSLPLSLDSIHFGIHNVHQIGYIQLTYRCVCCLGITFASIGSVLLFAFHLYLIGTNQTTYMYVKRYGLCGKKSANDAYDACHFDPDPASKNNSILTNMILFSVNRIPDDLRIAKVYDIVPPKPNKGINKYLDTQGVGCVPILSFKQD
eukprot:215804_1